MGYYELPERKKMIPQDYSAIPISSDGDLRRRSLFIDTQTPCSFCSLLIENYDGYEKSIEHNKAKNLIAESILTRYFEIYQTGFGCPQSKLSENADSRRYDVPSFILTAGKTLSLMEDVEKSSSLLVIFYLALCRLPFRVEHGQPSRIKVTSIKTFW